MSSHLSSMSKPFGIGLYIVNKISTKREVESHLGLSHFCPSVISHRGKAADSGDYSGMANGRLARASL